MIDVSALYRELDPLRPLGGHEHALYVDWQTRLNPHETDVASRLARAFARNATPEHPIVRLLTGHRGSGKTTELNRLAARLREGVAGRKVFVSTLDAAQYLDTEDVEAEDLGLQMVRQLAADFTAAGMDLAEQRYAKFFGSLWERFKDIRPETAKVGLKPFEFSFALDAFPMARQQFRQTLRGHLPTAFDLVNNELLPAAREFLKRNSGYDDILLLVDDLDKIPQKVLTDRHVTTHEQLFVDSSRTLRALDVSLLLTVPIELAYSPLQGRLRDDYGASIATVPLISIVDAAGNRIFQGEDALIELLGRRARQAKGSPDEDPFDCVREIFDTEDLLRRVVALSGGHLRGLLVMLTELLDWVDDLPIGADTVDRYVPRTAKDLARALLPDDKEILRQVKLTRGAIEDPRFFTLLQSRYVLAYESGQEESWYGVNPFLRDVIL